MTAIEGDGAVRALARFAALFGDLAAPPPPPGSEAPDELRRWQAGELAYWVTGPWQVGALHDRDRLAVSPLAHAPRGGQLLVVPRCAKHPADGWKLAAELTEVAVEVRFAESFATVPTRRAALEAASPLTRALSDALRPAERLSRDDLTPLLFDDLNPALAAVVAHDATPDEAIAGVRRAWRRLAGLSGPPATSPGGP
jgi:ABC-type glycerol-3-phosphate transport system substrate-binding protein